MTLKRRVPIEISSPCEMRLIGRRQHRNPLQIILAASEQLVGQALVHAVTAEEQPLRVAALLGAAVLVIDRLQIFDLRHLQRAVEALDDPARQADVIGMRMGHDQPGDFHVLERALEQRGPGRDRLLIAESGIDHRPAVAVGQQIDVHVVEPERQLEPDPQHARHHLDHLIRGRDDFPRGIAVPRRRTEPCLFSNAWYRLNRTIGAAPAEKQVRLCLKHMAPSLQGDGRNNPGCCLHAIAAPCAGIPAFYFAWGCFAICVSPAVDQPS